MKDYSNVRSGFPIMVYEQNNISEKNGGVRDTRLDLIGKKVNTEHGDGVIVAVELFPTTVYVTEERYLIEITNNNKTPILLSLFPNSRLCYYRREFKII